MSNTEAVNLNNNFKAMLRKGKKGIEIHVWLLYSILQLSLLF